MLPLLYICKCWVYLPMIRFSLRLAMFDLFSVSELCLMMLGWCWKVMLNAFGF